MSYLFNIKQVSMHSKAAASPKQTASFYGRVRDLALKFAGRRLGHLLIYTHQHDTQQRPPGHQRRCAQTLPAAMPKCEYKTSHYAHSALANTRPSSHRELFPEPPQSPLLEHLIAYCAPRDGDHKPLVSPPQSPPSDTPRQLPRPLLRLHKRPSIPPAPLPTTSTPSHSTMSKSPPPAMPLAKCLKPLATSKQSV